jgi:transposase
LPGRKTDVADAAWLAELLEHGLLRGSLVPPAAIRELGDLTRYPKRLIQAHSAEVQRIHKTLQDAGIKQGLGGRRRGWGLGPGDAGRPGRRERDPKVLAELATGRLRTKLTQLRQAPAGPLRGPSWAAGAPGPWALEQLEASIAELDTQVDRVLAHSPRLGTGWTPSPGWRSGPWRRSLARSGWT